MHLFLIASFQIYIGCIFQVAAKCGLPGIGQARSRQLVEDQLPKWQTWVKLVPLGKSPALLGMGDRAPPLMTGILIVGIYKPLRNRVDEFIPYYMEISWEFRPWHNWMDALSGSIQVDLSNHPPLNIVKSSGEIFPRQWYFDACISRAASQIRPC